MFFDTFEKMVQSWPVLISLSVDQMIFSANKCHHPLLCLPVCISAYAPSHCRHFVLLSELPSCCRKWLQTHSRRPLWSEWWTSGEVYREKMQGAHRMKCIWGYRWGMTALLPPWSLEYIEERGETKFQRLHRELGLYVFCRRWTRTTALPCHLLTINRQRHVGRILAECQNC